MGARIRGWAAAVAAMGVAATVAGPATGEPVELQWVGPQVVTEVAPWVVVPSQLVTRAGSRAELRADRRADRRAERARRLREERTIAEAATWQVDPELVRPHPTDSSRTAAAREELAAVAARLQERVAAWDTAHDAAVHATSAAEAARAALRAARVEVRAAQRQYRADRDALVSMLTQGYASTQLAPLALVLTSDDSDAAVLGDLTRLEEMGRVQTGVVEAAERSRSRLQAAEAAVEAAAQRAYHDLAVARAALADADSARQAVLDDVRRARSAVAESELADLAVRQSVADGYAGSITFPLAPGTPFTDLDNFGGRSRHWATTHTGDDFSAACGSPVVAATDGTVVVRTDQGWAGPWLVMVSTADGSLTTWYAHMQALDVVDGQAVHAGDPLGQVGQEGNATGCHLHFEVHPTGGTIYEDDTDPAAWLAAVGAYPGAS